jgi:hypothetical protein
MDRILLTDSLWSSAVYGSPPASGDNMETVIFAVMHDCTSLGVSRAKQGQWLCEKVAENIRSVTSMSLRLKVGPGGLKSGAFDPDVWSGRAVQEVSSILAMRSCINVSGL